MFLRCFPSSLSRLQVSFSGLPRNSNSSFCSEGNVAYEGNVAAGVPMASTGIALVCSVIKYAAKRLNFFDTPAQMVPRKNCLPLLVLFFPSLTHMQAQQNLGNLSVCMSCCGEGSML